MYAGRLNDRVMIQNFSTVKLPSGQPKSEWHDVKEVWAEVKGISGRELMTAGAERAEATIRVWMRYRNDVSAASRLVCKSGPFKGLIIEIAGPPVPDLANDRLEILCKQGVKQ
ncbi:phage head closure protein [Ewingella americana]|uniref:phage head closure protein n=1 Tax=Ewingella americana TaxID=41202 RepID=UPI001639F45F|nr:phage head closure protein [Ewingella americana]QMV50957.1 phage head closure protein [Ewingella americana]